MSHADYQDLPLTGTLTERERLLLVRIMEESAEVIQSASKVLRFGLWNWHPDDVYRTPNVAMLLRELDDLWRASEWLETHRDKAVLETERRTEEDSR